MQDRVDSEKRIQPDDKRFVLVHATSEGHGAEKSDVIELPSRIDKPCSNIQNRLKSIEQLIGQSGKSRTAVIQTHKQQDKIR